jgi:TetR/AcrR family transcriptional regulator
MMSRAHEIAAAARGRREKEKSARRASILAAARETFTSRGIAGATMEEVALRAEITKPTLYGYFRTKDEILVALMVPVFADIGARLEELRERLDSDLITDHGQLIAELIDALLFPYRADPERFRLTQLIHQTRLVESLDSDTLMRLDAEGRKDFKLARAILRDAMQRKLIREVAVAPLADVVWAITVGIIQVEDIKFRTGGRAQLAAPLQLATEMLTIALAPPDE